MAEGSFHCTVCGVNFTEDVILGDYNVTCPNGHVLPYETPAGEEKSECTCPVCHKIVLIDLLPGGVDLDEIPGLLEFNSGVNLINMWM